MIIKIFLAAAAGLTIAATAQAAPVASRLEPAPCVVALDPGKYRCGALIAPMTRRSDDRRTVRLPYAIFRTAPAGAKAGAITILAGGPGFTTVGMAAAVAPAFAPLGKDVVLLERRGTGFAEPALTCPAGTRLPSHDWDLAKVRACATGFRARGVDLNAFDSRAAAADLDDLRRLLGYGQWDLIGISSGSSLAFAVMRDFPATVRSAVHDSPYPFGIDAFADNDAKHLDKLTQVFAACAADAACNARYPNLRATLIKTVADLQKRPFSAGDRSLDGQTLLRHVADGTHEAGVLPLLPAMIDAAARRDGPGYAALRPTALPGGGLYAGIAPDKIYSNATWLSVECGERLPLFKGVRSATVEAWPKALHRLLRTEWSASDRAACAAWGYRAAPADINVAVTADIPTLVLLGEFDPQTPPSWGERAIAALPAGAGQLVVVPGAGHAVSTLTCPQQMIGAFIYAPRAPVDRRCLDASRIRFKTN